MRLFPSKVERYWNNQEFPGFQFLSFDSLIPYLCLSVFHSLFLFLYKKYFLRLKEEDMREWWSFFWIGRSTLKSRKSWTKEIDGRGNQLLRMFFENRSLFGPIVLFIRCIVVFQTRQQLKRLRVWAFCKITKQ